MKNRRFFLKKQGEKVGLAGFEPATKGIKARFLFFYDFHRIR